MEIDLKIGFVRKHLPRFIAASYRMYHGTNTATIFIREPKCRHCKGSLFNEEHMVHMLEHEYVELICMEICNGLQIQTGFDNMAFKWHNFFLKHNCPKNPLMEGIDYT